PETGQDRGGNMPRLVDQGVTKLTLVPGEDGIADVNAPKLSELLLGRDLTCQMVTTYEVRADNSDTTNERAVCEVANVVTPTVQTYMGRYDLCREWGPDAQERSAGDVRTHPQDGS